MKKKILIVLNYYYPYVSGVSEYARLIAEEFVKRGYQVTIVTANHADLQAREMIHGVRVIRTKVWFRISKGVVSPEFIWKAVRMSREHQIVNLHLPMLESGLLSMLIKKQKIVATYHCDIHMPKSFFNNFIVKVMDFSHRICLARSRKILVSSKDYALHSRVAGRYGEKLVEAGAPMKDYHAVKSSQTVYDTKRIGFCGRIVEEKGIDVLLKAYQIIQKRRDDVLLVVGGDYQNVAGGSVYPKLKKLIQKNHISNVEFIGKIQEEKMEEFYSSLDVLVLPSINSLEAFGMVQVEAMFCGTPVVASDLPGVRTIVQNTGMGEIVKPNNAEDLADKIERVLDHKEFYKKPRNHIEKIYGLKTVVKAHKKAYMDK